MPAARQPRGGRGEDVSIGELFRGQEEFKTEFRSFAAEMRTAIAELPRSYVPRAELDAREATLTTQLDTTDRTLADVVRTQVGSLRGALNLAVPGLLSLTAIAVAVVRH